MLFLSDFYYFMHFIRIPVNKIASNNYQRWDRDMIGWGE